MDGVNTAKPAGEYNLVSDCSTEFIILNLTEVGGWVSRWVANADMARAHKRDSWIVYAITTRTNCTYQVV